MLNFIQEATKKGFQVEFSPTIEDKILISIRKIDSEMATAIVFDYRIMSGVSLLLELNETIKNAL